MTRLLDAAEIAYVEVRQHDLLYNLCGGDGKTEIIKTAVRCRKSRRS